MKRDLIFILGLLLATLGHAQPWTVQTVALQDYGEALAVSDQLRALSYDAYVDFGLYEGQQFVRVRVGCFDDQDSAAFFASQLVGVTAEAVAVPLEAAPKTSFCVRRVVGFEPPPVWGVLGTTASAVSFWVEVLGQRRFVVFTGNTWRVAQSEQDVADLTRTATAERGAALFRQDANARVLCDWRGTPFNVTTGQLLWQGGAWAIVLEAGAVTAYHVEGVD